MRFPLRAKLITSFLTVIIVTGAVAMLVGVYLIESGIVREAQEKVTLDLNSAQQIYDQKLESIELVLTYSLMRKFAVVEALKEGDQARLLEALRKSMERGGLDFLTLTDREGIVVIRTSNPEVFGDCKAYDEIVGKVLREKKPLSSTQILPYRELNSEMSILAMRALIQIIPTRMAKPSNETENSDGMVLKAAVPLLDADGELLGVLYGGILLNRNYEIVDQIKDVVYRGVKYEGKDIGTATIFQKDIRISTNVLMKSGERAIGTRVSSEVYDKVLGERQKWTSRAFVVNDWYLTAYSSITNIEEEPIGMLYVGMLEKKYSDMKIGAFWFFFGVAAAGSLLAFILAYVLAGKIINPVKTLEQGFEAIERGDFDFDVSIGTSDEISMLARSFTRVRKELKETYEKLQTKIEAADEDLKRAYRELHEKQKQLVQKEKLASMGQLSAGVAHELNNPLGTILIFSSMLLRKLPEDDPRYADHEMIVNEAKRCKDIVRGLLNFARQSRPSKTPTDFAQIVREVITIMARKAKEHGVELKKSMPDDFPTILIDQAQMKQMLVNLVDNGIDAIEGEGEVIVQVDEDVDRDGVVIKVIDTGCGMHEENLSKLFTPFFTTKEKGRGTGLGLAIAYGIVKMHSGNITAESHPGEGTTLTIWLPIERDEQNVASVGCAS